MVNVSLHCNGNPKTQWFSTFLKLQPFNTVPYVVMTPNHRIIPLLLHICNYATVMDHNVIFNMHDV